MFGQRFVEARKPGWRSLGKTFDTPVTASEAVYAAKMDFNFVKLPLLGDLASAVVDTGKFGIFREPTEDDNKYRFYGVVSEDYSILQNTDIARVIDPLTRVWPVETVGALGTGETMFMSLNAGEGQVKGERVLLYFGLTDTRDGGTSLKIMFTPVRFVCTNTLITGLKQSIVSSSIIHTPGASNVLTARVNLLQQMQRALETTMASFEQLASAAITDDDAISIFADTYPEPKRSAKQELLQDYDDVTGPQFLGSLYDEAARANESWKYYANKNAALRDAVFENYHRICDEHPTIARTAWAAYNSVVEFADFREGHNVEMSALFGSRAAEKQRAFASAMRMVQS
jgi:hypothetical protein